MEAIDKLQVILNKVDIPEYKQSLEYRLVKLAEDFLLGEYAAAFTALPDASPALEYRAQLVEQLVNLRK